jgi:phage baseplate assembly protein W|tara:strand:- start:12118 stop:12519 length:402 start_codon:yes stop_codon:yes gene_type:complete
MPVERSSVGFKDISLSLKRNPLTKDLLVLKNESAISRSVQNLVLTLQGEKMFDPSLGCAVSRLLFENVDSFTADNLRREIEAVIKNYEPRVIIDNVKVIPDFDNNAMDVTLIYLIIGIDVQPQQLSFVLLPTR